MRIHIRHPFNALFSKRIRLLMVIKNIGHLGLLILIQKVMPQFHYISFHFNIVFKQIQLNSLQIFNIAILLTEA